MMSMFFKFWKTLTSTCTVVPFSVVHGGTGEKCVCIGRESNPGLPRGRREFYHWTTNAFVKAAGAFWRFDSDWCTKWCPREARNTPFKTCYFGNLFLRDHSERFLDRKILFFFVPFKLVVYLNWCAGVTMSRRWRGWSVCNGTEWIVLTPVISLYVALCSFWEWRRVSGRFPWPTWEGRVSDCTKPDTSSSEGVRGGTAALNWASQSALCPTPCTRCMDYIPAVLTVFDCKLSFENTQLSLVQSSQNMCISFQPSQISRNMAFFFIHVSTQSLSTQAKIIGKQQLSLAGIHKRQVLQKARSFLAGSGCLLLEECVPLPSVWRHSLPRAKSNRFKVS